LVVAAPIFFKFDTWSLTVGLFPSDKQEASKFLKTLLIECKLDSNSYVLLEPDEKVLYQLVTKLGYRKLWIMSVGQQIKRITTKYNLAVKRNRIKLLSTSLNIVVWI